MLYIGPTNQEVQYIFLKTGTVTCLGIVNIQIGRIRRIVLSLNVYFRFQNIEHVVPGFAAYQNDSVYSMAELGRLSYGCSVFSQLRLAYG